MSLLSKITGIHLGGASLGALIGSVVPGVGTAIGGFLGGAFDTAKGLGGGGISDASGYHPNVPGVDWGHPGNMGSDPFGLGITPQAGQTQNGRCPSGYHPNRSALAACKRHGPAAPGTICVRNRHMNPANGKAIGRSVRRIKAGEKQYRKVFTILHHKPVGKLLPKGKR